MRYAKTVPVVCLVAAILISCGGEDRSAEVGGNAAELANTCHQFLDVICGKAESCGFGGAADCVEAAVRAFPGNRTCDDVIMIRNRHELEVCQKEIEVIACAEVLSRIASDDLPTECSDQLVML